MKKYAHYFILSLLLVLTGVSAQTGPPGESNPTFTQEELDQMLAPIALYPDTLLSQVLMAATYPLAIVQAARWSSTNSTPHGNAAIQDTDNQNWDPSIKFLLAFPQILQILDEKIDWTERLGDAFLAQPSEVIDTVQKLRQKARNAGNLISNDHIDVIQSDDTVEIVTVHPDMVYVPYYDPLVVYGSWWWPAYPPVFWRPWPNYYWDGGFAWGVGIGIGAAFFLSSWDWHNHRIFIPDRGSRGPGNGHWWQHVPDHRRGLPYRDPSLNHQFGRTVRKPPSREAFRGHEISRSSVLSEAHRHPSIEARPERQTARRNENRGTPPNVHRIVAEPRAHAFENVGRGAEARNFSNRGNAGLPDRPSSASPRGGSPRPSHH